MHKHIKRFYKSIWLFPLVLLVPLIFLSVNKISGSSIGTLHNILYGNQNDPNLLANKPRDIRSDEWLVNTQLTVAQYNSSFPKINHNIGNGEDVSVQDVPYKDWSIVFKPHNLVFFTLPLENAFALKWWLMGYLLIVSSYFFILTLLPGRKKLAILLSLSLFFSAFVQWWYAYGTLGSLYYSLFIAINVIYLWKQKTLKKKLILAAPLIYLISCFSLVLYPPFQIACGLVLAVFLISYGIQENKSWNRSTLISNISIALGAGLVAGLIFGAFLFTRSEVIQSINHTAYPGTRILKSGGIQPDHFLSSQLGHQFISDNKTASYLIDNKARSNQSEASNFLLLAPFLFIPSAFLIYIDKKKKKPTDWPLLGLLILFLVYLLELFVRQFSQLSRVLLLDKVGSGRVLIGVGLLNFMLLVLFIRNLSSRKFNFPVVPSIIYFLILVIIELAVNLHAHYNFGTFIGLKLAILLSIPLPLITYMIIKKQFILAASIYFIFSIYIGIKVNPLYKGLAIIQKNPISITIKKVSSGSNLRWANEGGYEENLAIINNKPSISSVYDYPQFNMWQSIPNTPKQIYNRYAHVGVEVYNDNSTPTKLNLLTPDSFTLQTSSCSKYLRNEKVGFVLTATILTGNCIKLKDTLSFPITTLYIYQIQN